MIAYFGIVNLSMQFNSNSNNNECLCKINSSVQKIRKSVKAYTSINN